MILQHKEKRGSLQSGNKLVAVRQVVARRADREEGLFRVVVVVCVVVAVVELTANSLIAALDDDALERDVERGGNARSH